MPPVPLAPGLTQVAALASNGKLLVFGLDEVRVSGGGRGVIVMGLDDGATLAAVALARPGRVVVRGTNRAGREIDVALDGDALARHVLRRARKGVKLVQKLKPTGFGPLPS